MQRPIRWFVVGLAMLIATVSTWAFLANLLGPLLVPTLELDGANADPSSPNWRFSRPYSQWEEPASSVNSPPEAPLPPWWYITARAPNPYWVPWLAGPMGTVAFGALSLAALGLIVFVSRIPRVDP